MVAPESGVPPAPYATDGCPNRIGHPLRLPDRRWTLAGWRAPDCNAGRPNGRGAVMANVPIACSSPRCPGFATPRGRGRCVKHQQTTGERGYGIPHQQARQRLAATLPTPCGYCGHLLKQGDTWVAAHRIDGDPTAGWMAACPTCNEQAKHRGMQSYRIDGDGGSKLGRTGLLIDPRADFHTYNAPSTYPDGPGSPRAGVWGVGFALRHWQVFTLKCREIVSAAWFLAARGFSCRASSRCIDMRLVKHG
jgi:hypothetical protein